MGMKVVVPPHITPNSFFVSKKISHLYHIITREVIKLNPIKVQDIKYLKRPDIMDEAQSISRVV